MARLSSWDGKKVEEFLPIFEFGGKKISLYVFSSVWSGILLHIGRATNKKREWCGPLKCASKLFRERNFGNWAKSHFPVKSTRIPFLFLLWPLTMDQKFIQWGIWTKSLFEVWCALWPRSLSVIQNSRDISGSPFFLKRLKRKTRMGLNNTSAMEKEALELKELTFFLFLQHRISRNHADHSTIWNSWTNILGIFFFRLISFGYTIDDDNNTFGTKVFHFLLLCFSSSSSSCDAASSKQRRYFRV